jgi:hypothetical protein
MDKTIGDIYAILNAQNILLKGLYIHLRQKDLKAFEDARGQVMLRMERAVTTLGDPAEAANLRPQTNEAVRLFFREVQAAE